MPDKECLHEKDIEEMMKRDQKQDDNHAELKGYVQGISTQQQIHNFDMVVVKKEIENIKNTLGNLNDEIHNGFAKKIMAEAYNNTVQHNNEMMNKFIDILQQNSQNSSVTIQKQNDNSTNVWNGIFGKGGIAVTLIGLAALVIKLILG